MKKKATAKKKAPAKKAAAGKFAKKKVVARKAAPKPALRRTVAAKPVLHVQAHGGVRLPPVSHSPPAYSMMHQRDWAHTPPPKNIRMPKR